MKKKSTPKQGTFYKIHLPKLMLFFLLSVGLCDTDLLGQSSFSYSLDLKKDLIITGISGLSFFSESLVGKQPHTEPPSYFTNLNKNNINRFDRSATNHWNTDLDNLRENLSTISFLSGLTIASALTLTTSMKGTGHTGKNLLTTGVMFFEGGFFVIGLFELSKVSTSRPRPYAYNPNLSYETKTAENDYKESFFSGASTITAYGTFFAAKVINDLFPESGWKYAGWGLATGISGYIGWLSVQSGHHFPTDVLTGIIIGGATAILIPELHKKRGMNDASSLRVSPLINGLHLSYQF